MIVGVSANKPTSHDHQSSIGPRRIAIIGAGIFVITGTAAAQYAGPGIMLAFLLGAIACGFVGLCYAEFASMIPVAGSAYTYSYVVIGELFAWIIGWDLVLEYAVGAATVATAWSAYFVKLCHQLGIAFPQALSASPFDDTPGLINFPAAFIVLSMTALLIRGTKESAVFNAVMVALKVIIVLVVVGLGWGYIDPANHTPYIPPNTGNFGEFGWSGVVQGLDGQAWKWVEPRALAAEDILEADQPIVEALQDRAQVNP